MLRFIFNFIFFGVLFFIIWQFFPDAFTKLVEWARDIVEFIENLIKMVAEKVNGPHPAAPEKPPVEPKTAASSLLWLAMVTLQPRGTTTDLDK